MKPRRISFVSVMLLLISLGGLTAPPSVAGAQGRQATLEMYTATVSAAEFQDLQTRGFDVTSVETTEGGVRVALVLSTGERNALRKEGIDLEPWRDRQGRTQTQRAALQQANGFTIWRSYDEPGGIRDEMYELARRNPQLLKLEVLGTTHEGREYIALKMTQGAREVPDGTRPAVLYVATHHAREWIS